METWDLWYPDAASRGLSFARASIEQAALVWVHSAPPSLRVEVRDERGNVVAAGDQLRLEGDGGPMTLLRRAGTRIEREDRWPSDDDLGAIVVLPGGEAGVLKEWWNAPDGREWRWSVEFFNRR